MVVWVAGISAHSKAFPKAIDRLRDDPQAADRCEAYVCVSNFKRMKRDIRHGIDCGRTLEFCWREQNAWNWGLNRLDGNESKN